MVKVRTSRGRCSGSIIASKYVLTVAHCVKGAENAWIELGGFYSGDTKIRKNVTRIIIHPGFQFPENDLALLETSSPIDLNIYTPVCLRKTTRTFDWKMAEVLVYRNEMQKSYRGLFLPPGYCLGDYEEEDSVLCITQLGGLQPVSLILYNTLTKNMHSSHSM